MSNSFSLFSRRKAVGLFIIVSLVTGVATAQDFPSRPIKIVVANTAGTAPDTVARLVAPEISKILGQPVVFENRPGAAMAIGFDHVAKAAPDGYTIALVYPSALVTLPLTVKELRFSPLKDLPPLIGLGEGRLMLATSPQAPWKTFNEFVLNAKSSPGKWNYGWPDPSVRLLIEDLSRGVGISLTNVPYSGAAAYYQALLAGDIQIAFAAEATALSFGPRARILAVTGTTRSTTFPDAPTFAEVGVPRIRGLSYSLNLPVGVPKTVADKLYAAVERALQQPSLKESFAKLHLEMFSDNTPQANAQRLAESAASLAEVARQIGLQPQ